MKLIIDIDKKLYDHIKNDKVYYIEDGEELYSLAQNGEPLPENIDGLISINELLTMGGCPPECKTCNINTNDDNEFLHCPIRIFDIESINDCKKYAKSNKD